MALRVPSRSRGGHDNEPPEVIFYTIAFEASGAEQSPWKKSLGSETLKEGLKRSFPRSEFHPGSPMVINATGDFWDELESSGRLLSSFISQFENASLESPIVILSHGLGGLMALQFIKDPQILNKIATFVFFGTPVNVHDRKFSQAVEDCARVESGVKYKKDVSGRCKEIMNNFPVKEKHLVSVYETLKCEDMVFSKPKIIVDQNMASFSSAQFSNTCYIASGRDHCGMSDMDFQKVIGAIQDRVKEHNDGHAQQRSQARVRQSSPFSVATPVPLPDLQPNVPPVHLIRSPRDPYHVRRAPISNMIRHALIESGPGRPGQRMFGLHGLPGMGKTQIARQFVEEVLGEFTYILWVDATSETSILGDYAEYAEKLGLGTNVTDLPTAGRVLGDWFQKCDRNFLVILDGANDISVLRSRWPQGDNASVLVTTVEKTFVTGHSDMKGSSVEQLGEDEAAGVILEQVGAQSRTEDAEADRKEAKVIASNVHSMALAVRIAITLINQSGMKLAKFNEKYPTESRLYAPLKAHHTNSIYDKYGKTVQSAFRELLHLLEDNPRKLLNMLSLLHSSRIPEALFDPQNLNGELLEFGFLRDYEEYKFENISNILIRGDNDDSNTFELHGFMSRVIQDEMSPDERYQALSISTTLLLHAFDLKDVDKKILDAKRREKFKLYNLHIDSINSFYEAFRAPGRSRHAIPPTYIRLLANCTWLWYTTGLFKIGLQRIKTANTFFKELQENRVWFDPDPDDEDIIEAEIKVVHAHACIATEIGNFHLSLEKFREEEEIVGVASRRNLKVIRESVRRSMILGGIANSLQGLGQHEEAMAMYERCLRNQPDVEGIEDYKSPHAVNVCRSLLALNMVDEAEKRLEDLVRRRATVFGHRDNIDYISGHQRFVLGNVYLRQNKFEDALFSHEYALANFKATKGKMHHKTGDAWHKMGWHHARMGNLAEAEKAFGEALKIYHDAKLEGDDIFPNGEIARSSFHISRVLKKMGKHVEAESALAEAVGLRVKVIRAMAKRREMHGIKDGAEEDEQGAELAEEDFEKLVSLWAR